MYNNFISFFNDYYIKSLSDYNHADFVKNNYLLFYLVLLLLELNVSI